MIAAQHNLNIVLSGDVTNEVTLRLEDVEVATALDAILTANGFSYFLKDDVIVVKPADIDAPGELESRSITLKYLAPITAQKALEPGLSAKGSVVILDRAGDDPEASKYHTNRILVTDFPQLMDNLLRTIGELDIEERTILIEAKIIETTIDTESNLGISWPTSITARLSNADDGSSGSTTTTTTTDNLLDAAGIYNPSNGNWTWGKLSVDEVAMVLNILEQNGNSRLVSDPRITTLENHEAEFKFNTVIPIQTINRFTEGAATSDIVTFEDEEVGISLKVLPRINEEGMVTLQVMPKVEDIIGYTGPIDNQKPITASRSITTRITVKDGETVALGGLLKETETETIQRVPLLGHIPLLGKLLFTRKSTEKSTSDLVILITPHILP
jgi:type II secretory pathway component GspD/PulD (secretin)